MDKTHVWRSKWNETIGGSRAAAVCGLGAGFGKTPRDVIDEMAGLVDPPDLSGNPDIIRGTMLEPVCRERLAQELGLMVIPHDQGEFLMNQKYPFAHVLPDGWVNDAEPVELKVPRPRTWRRMYIEGVPDYYQIQCQHAMAVLDRDFVHFAALDPVEMAVLYVKIPRDEIAIIKIMENERALFNAVQALRVGDDTLARVFNAEPVPLPKGESTVKVIDTPRMRTFAQKYLQAKDILKRAEEYRDLRKAQLLAVAADEAGLDTECFEIPKLARFFNKLSTRRTFDHEKAVKDHPELEVYYKTGKPYRWFRDIVIEGED